MTDQSKLDPLDKKLALNLLARLLYRAILRGEIQGSHVCDVAYDFLYEHGADEPVPENVS